MFDAIFYGILVAAGVFVAWTILHGYWRGLGLYLVHRAGPRPLRASRHRIWRDPGDVEGLDLTGGPGGRDGAPAAPFMFIEEQSAGSQPCVSVHDARGRRWRVKWGHEVQPESFAVRLAWACGYFAEETYFVAAGTVEQAANLKRSIDCIDATSGQFTNARFELDDPAVKKMFEEHSWAWNDNPFVGTKELDGLKIVVMLLSNWDTKDRRDVARGSNTAIFELRNSRRRWGSREARYLITDWGGSMGKWGTNIVNRGRWDPEGFEAQTPAFATAVQGRVVSFGYAGQRTADIARGIPIEHARWFHGIAGRLSERQLVEALAASGASDDEQTRFARAMIARIRQLGNLCGIG